MFIISLNRRATVSHLEIQEEVTGMQHQDWEKMDRIISFVNDFYRDNHRSPSVRQVSTGINMSRSAVHRYLLSMTEKGLIDYDGEIIVTEQVRKISDTTVPVGIIGSIPCGNLSLEEEAVEEIVNLPVALFGKGELFLLHASGDSMTGAGIDDGDLVLIRKQEEAQSGDIVVAFVEGEGNTLKRYRMSGHTVFLHPENPKYRDIPLKDCKIQGVAISVIKHL